MTRKAFIDNIVERALELPLVTKVSIEYLYGYSTVYIVLELACFDKTVHNQVVEEINETFINPLLYSLLEYNVDLRIEH